MNFENFMASELSLTKRRWINLEADSTVSVSIHQYEVVREPHAIMKARKDATTAARS
jgi:hypothetical protein